MHIESLALWCLAIEGIPYVIPSSVLITSLSEIHQEIKIHLLRQTRKTTDPMSSKPTDKPQGYIWQHEGLRQEGGVGRLTRPRRESVQRLTQLWVCLQVRWTTSASGDLHARRTDDHDGESPLLFITLVDFVRDGFYVFCCVFITGVNIIKCVVCAVREERERECDGVISYSLKRTRR